MGEVNTDNKFNPNNEVANEKNKIFSEHQTHFCYSFISIFPY
jgi:hypothetical protein